MGLVSGTWKLEQSYRSHLVGDIVLRDLPEEPEFIFNAAHLERGVIALCRKLVFTLGALATSRFPTSHSLKRSRPLLLPAIFPSRHAGFGS